MTDNNLKLWDSAQITDPRYTKSFTRGGGFRGTSTNATYLAKRATETFGPCGIGWGIRVLDEQLVNGHPVAFDADGRPTCHTVIHKVRVQLWYELDGKHGEIEQFGQTEMVGKNNRGLYTDEEAPKKSITDAMTKCMSLLGFAADIHLGLYDDNKYVAELRQQFAQEDVAPEQQQDQPPARDLGPRLTVQQHTKAMNAAQTYAELKRAFALAWKQNENPADPHDKTPAQMKLKGVYDDRAQALNERAADAIPDPFAEEGT